jgi:hypothetical protein
VICHKPGNVVAACPVNDDHLLLIIGDKSSICISATDLTSGSRAAAGVVAIKSTNVTGIARIN